MFFNKYQKEYDELFKFLTNSQYDTDFGLKKEYAKEFLTYYQKPIGKKFVLAKSNSSASDFIIGTPYEEALIAQAYEVFIRQIFGQWHTGKATNPPGDKISKTAIAIIYNLEHYVESDPKFLKEFTDFQETYYPNIYEEVFQ